MLDRIGKMKQSRACVCVDPKYHTDQMTTQFDPRHQHYDCDRRPNKYIELKHEIEETKAKS